MLHCYRVIILFMLNTVVKGDSCHVCNCPEIKINNVEVLDWLIESKINDKLLQYGIFFYYAHLIIIIPI